MIEFPERYDLSRVYVAGGWFNDEQMDAIQDLESFVSNWSKECFKPRVDNNSSEGMTGDDKWDELFRQNVAHIQHSTVVIASTVGKDMGTLWECGFAIGQGIPVIYYTPGIKKVNLMLSRSGDVCRDLDELFNLVVKGIKPEIDNEIE